MICLNEDCPKNFPSHFCREVKCPGRKLRKPKSKRDEIIKKIEENDPKILGALADLILAQRGAPKIKEVKATVATLNKRLREELKKWK